MREIRLAVNIDRLVVSDGKKIRAPIPAPIAAKCTCATTVGATTVQASAAGIAPPEICRTVRNTDTFGVASGATGFYSISYLVVGKYFDACNDLPVISKI